jgi:small subunit ribosomal protein S4e
MHTKRIVIPNSWPLPKKLNTFVVSPMPGKLKERSLALAVVIRDLLQETKTFKETKKIIKSGEIEINSNIIKDEKYPVTIFDRIFIKKLNKYFTLYLDTSGKIKIKEIDSKKYLYKPVRIIGKTILKNKKIQLNLEEGYNLLVDKNEFKMGDSVLINLKNKKIEKVLPLSKGSIVLLIKGELTGKIGKVLDVQENKVKIKLGDQEKDMSPHNLYVIEENDVK